jgi:uncharacterized membrane protein YgaE (UPF0421/DUF939 family)
MDSITQEEFEEAAAEAEEDEEEESEEVSSENFDKMLEEMKNPVQAQQKIAVHVKIFLDKRIKQEMSEKEVLSENTRRWVESYNNILEKIQKALHGDKSVNLHLHHISHSQIATKMREAMKDDSNFS